MQWGPPALVSRIHLRAGVDEGRDVLRGALLLRRQMQGRPAIDVQFEQARPPVKESSDLRRPAMQRCVMQRSQAGAIVLVEAHPVVEAPSHVGNPRALEEKARVPFPAIRLGPHRCIGKSERTDGQAGGARRDQVFPGSSVAIHSSAPVRD